MSDKSGGFFSSVGRFFSVGASATKSKDGDKSNDEGTSNSSSKSSPSASPALKNILSVDNEAKIASDETSVNTSQNHRIGSRLRYLSPTALDRRTSASNGLEIDVDAVPDIFFSTPAVSTNRKRQLTELDKQILPQSFRSESVKRSRFLNRSLLEPTLNSSMNNERKMDMTWCGELTANHSPASSITNFSLLSRRSGATTNGSLSTRTQEIFKKLEGANTPAKEVQRMSMLRAGIARPEKWGSFSESKVPNGSATGTPPPPLKKAGDAIPSRIQLISKTMGMSARRAPYWTDLTRKRTSSKNGDTGSSDSMKSLNGNFATAELSSLFSLDLPAPKKTASTASTTTINSSNSRKQHASIMKGPDGKPVSRNTFKLSDDIEEVDEDSQKLPPIPTTTLQNPQPLKLAPEYAPKRGFLDDLAFSFTAPVDLVTAVGTAKTASTASSHKASESSSESNAESTEKQTSESSGNESDSEESEDSEVDVGEENGSEVKESRPQTSADTISSAGGSNQSSKDSSPKVAKDAEPVVVAPAPVVDAGSKKWECQSCFCSWDSTLSECGACGEARPGGSGTGPKSQPKPSEKQLVSNLSSFASNTPSTVKFGFGSGASTTTTIASTTSNTIPFGSGSSVAPLFGAPKTTAPPPTTVPATIPVAPTTIASAPVAAVTSSSNGTRVDWECPDCMVSNKASDDKCPCCSHVKYASAEASSNVFGNRAFKPLSSTGSTISFGVGGSTATTQPSAFAFGLSKTTEVAPTSTPAFGLSAKPAVSSAPVEKPSAPEVPKTAGSLFGNIAKPADSATTSFLAPGAASSTSSLAPTAGSSLFGGSTGSIFNLNKTNTTETAKPGLFGSILDKETHVTTTPVSVALPSSTDSTQSKSAIPTIAPTMSLFGNSSTGSFGGSSMFGNSKTELPKISSTLSFGNPTTAAAPVSTATAEAVKTNVFGSNSASASTSLFGAGSSSTATNLFTTKPADSTTSSIFGKPISFGDDSGTTTTDGAPAKRGLFSSDSQKLQFGGQQKVEMPKFTGFGNPASTASTTSGSLFGGASTNPPMFGGPSSSSIPTFSTSNSSSTSGFPSSTATPFGNAGTTSTSGVFGAFGNKPSQPGLSSSSSTNSLFGQAPADSSNPFGGTSNNGFNFGASSSTTGATAGGGGVFQFGNAATSAPAPTAAPGGGAFQFGGNMSVPQAPAPGGMENAFSYQAPSGVGARKMAMARRRNMRK